MVALIAAYDRNRVIGNKGRIPWNIKGEQRRFRELTMGNIVVMGRKTYEEIGRPLSGRTTIVVSSSVRYEADGLHTARSLYEALGTARDRDVYIAGGAGLYKEAMVLADKMYITEIDAEFEGDTYFPEFDSSQYVRTVEEYNSGEYPYVYVTYDRLKTVF